MKRIRLVFLLFTMSFSLHATIIRVGTPVFAPPFAMNTAHFVVQGFDIDFMNSICNRLRWQCVYIPIKDNNFFAALDKNQIDLALGGLIITTERMSVYKFSIPYLPSKGGIAFLASSKFKTLSDLKNKRIGALQGTVYNGYLTQNFPVAIKATSSPNYGDLILSVQNGQLDAAFINYYTALYLEHQYPGIVQTLKEYVDLGYGVGIAALFSNSDRIEEINKVILELQEDGTFVRLYNYYFQFFVK